MAGIRDGFTIMVFFGWLSVAGTCFSAGRILPADDAPQPMAPQESAQRIRLPDGLRIELVASEPLVQDPTCIAFDERGRLFVCELHGYNLEGHLDVVELNKTGELDTKVRRIRWERMGGGIAEQARKNQYGSVKLLEDEDGDGRLDLAHVWANDLPTCYGIIAARGGVIAVCAPDIVFLADRDGDNKAEIREILYTGFHHELLERGINNPRWGLDNWIYVGAGGGGGLITGPRLKQPVRIGNSDFRMKPDGSAIEPVNGSVGTFGLAINDVGDRFPCSGGRPAVYALPLPYRYLSRNPYVATPPGNHSAANYSRGYRISRPHPWRVRRRQNPAWIKFYGEHETNSNYFTGGCGGEIYRAGLLPRKYRQCFYYCEPSLNIVHRCRLERDGPGYKARRAKGEEVSEFLASTDQWFRPVNLRVGPDGALYIVDMYREIIEDYSAIPRFLQQQYGVIKGDDRGRIWRVVPETSDTSSRVHLASATREELVDSISSPNAWWRNTAQRLLIERKDGLAGPLLSNQVRHGPLPETRVHSLYTLLGLGRLRHADVVSALSDPHFMVRLHAIRLSEQWLGSASGLTEKLIALCEDPDPRVRLQVALTLGESKDPRATNALLDLARNHGHERWMSSAILSSAVDSAGKLLFEIIEASDGVKNAQALLEPLAATSAARQEFDRIEEVLRALTAKDNEFQAACLKGFVRGFPSNNAGDRIGDGKWESLNEFVKSDSASIRSVAVRLGARLGLLDRPEFQRAFSNAADRAVDMSLPATRRIQSIELLASSPFETVAPVFARMLDARQGPDVQIAAVRALSASNDERVTAALFSRWAHLTPRLREEVLDSIFSRENRLSGLLDAIESGLIHVGNINASRRERLLKNNNRDIARRANRLFLNATADAEFQRRAERYREVLSRPRNLGNGKALFAKHCLSCHKLKGEGHEVGPELGSLINKPDESILLDIIDPSRHIESEYVSYIVITTEGSTHTGILVSDSATSVTLRKEKGVDVSILRREIETMQASQVSIMPSNLHEQIEPQGLADIIAYLRASSGQ